MPFFPRILVEFVGLDHPIGQRHLLLGGPLGQRLEAVPQLEQVLAVAAQLPGQLGRGDAVGDAADHQQELGTGALGARERRAGEGVEDGAAILAAVVQERVAVAAVDPAVGGAGVADGAAQSTGVQPADEAAVAGRFVQEVGNGEVHSPPARAKEPGEDHGYCTSDHPGGQGPSPTSPLEPNALAPRANAR
jgi:hypothetical protein